MKKTASVILAIVIVLSLCSFASLAIGPDDILSADGEAVNSGKANSSVFAFGYDVSSSADASGLNVSAGYNVTVGGDSEYILSAGFAIAVTGTAKKDAFAAGKNISVIGTVTRDLYAAGDTVTVSGEIGRNLYVAAEKVIIEGKIGGDVHISASSITVKSGAVILGTVSYNDDAETSFAASFDKVTYTVPKVETAPTEPSALDSAISAVFHFLGYVALAFAILAVTGVWEKADTSFGNASFGKYAAAFGIGCLAILGAIPVFALLCLLRVGVRLAFVLLLLFIAALVASLLFIAFFIGRLIMRRLFKARQNYWLELPVGIFVWCVIEMIPVLKVFALIVGIPLGLGTMIMLLGKKRTAPTAPAATDHSVDQVTGE